VPPSFRYLTFAVAALALAASKPKEPPVSHGENESLRLSATLYADRDAVKELIGDDLGGHYVVVAVKVEPKYGKEVMVSRDDFILRTSKDGERTTPFAPSQIAGRGALVVSSTGSGRAAMGDGNGPVWGGIPGTGGRPSRLPGSGGSIGAGGSGEEGARATVQSGAREKDNPLLQVLKEKVLAEKKTAAPLSGLLYFPMEKQKPKDLDLTYATPEGKLNLKFK
jgi:hypothetical protein